MPSNIEQLRHHEISGRVAISKGSGDLRKSSSRRIAALRKFIARRAHRVLFKKMASSR